MGHYGQTMISDKAGVRQDEELESHLNKGHFVVESPLARFVLLQFCFFFEVSCLYKSIKGPYKEYKANIRAEIANKTRCYVLANARNGLIHLFSVSHLYITSYAFKYVNCL
jgi:hypothetical protein